MSGLEALGFLRGLRLAERESGRCAQWVGWFYGSLSLVMGRTVQLSATALHVMYLHVDLCVSHLPMGRTLTALAARMFLFSGRGYWQELIESIIWAHKVVP